MLENIFNSPILTSLALTLLHFLWQGLLVAAVLKSALLIFNNNKPQLRYALSALAMLVNLLLPIITFIIIYQTEISTVNTLASSLALNEFILELKQPDALFTYKELTEILPLLLPYVSILWLVAITLLASKLLIEITTVNRLPQQNTIAPSNKLQTRFDELAAQINLKIAPRLLISLKVDVPMAIGWLKPVVLLPAKMVTGLNSAQLEMLILHELAHIRRHDYLVNFLQTLVEILLFFHPAVLWVSKQMRNEREYCSDDIAVQHCGNAIAYAHTLADTAALCTKKHNHTIPAMAMAASGGDLKQRVIRLVDHHCAPSNNISKWFASVTIIFSILLLSSKQLLTMPLLDIWYNDNPWKQLNQVKDNQIASNQKPVLTTNNVENLSTYHSNNITTTDKELANTSIAQQLLVPSQQDAKSKKDNSLTLAATLAPKEKIAKIAEKHTITLTVKEKVTIPTQQKPSANTQQSNEFNAKLTSLAPNHLAKTKSNVEDVITNDSLMVEKAFSRTDSNNSYQQELTNLAQSPTLSTEQTKIEHYENKTIASDAISSQAIAQTDNHFMDVNSSKEKEIIAVKTTWQNAEQLESVDPIYPSVAKRKGIEIEVKVDFTIGVDGQIKNIQFDPKSNINYFKSSIRSAIKQWRFLPAKVDNQPVESQMSKVFAFSLQS